MQTVLAAFKFLTICGSFGARNPTPDTIGRAAGYFIYVGLLLGLVLALANYVLAAHLDAAILSLVLVALLITATGARHLSGLKDSFTALGGFDGERNEALGFAAVALVILFKSAAAESMDEIATLSWLLTPVLARWCLVIILYGYHIRFDETVRQMAEHINFAPVLASTAATLALLAYFLGRKGLWIALTVSIFALSLRALFYRRHAVISRSNLGAVVELGEALSLVLLASL